MEQKIPKGYFFKCTPEEMALIEQRRDEAGIKNRSAFIKKMCIDGHVFVLEMDTMNEIGKLLRVTANNANQLAKRVNSGGEAYREDVTEVNDQLTEIRTNFGSVLTLLTKIADPKPGKRFIPPPTVRSLPEYAEPPTTEEGA